MPLKMFDFYNMSYVEALTNITFLSRWYSPVQSWFQISEQLVILNL